MTISKTITKACTLATISFMFINPVWGQDTNEETIQDVSYEEGVELIEDEGPTIATSKPHHLPKLLQMKTAKVLDSYSIGFAGSGNIHSLITNFSPDKLYGSIAVGLGDIAELGYQYDPYHSVGVESENYFNGYMKLQLLDESEYIPTVSISAGSNISKNFTNADDIEYRIERQFFELLFAKQFQLDNHTISIYPGLKYSDDEVTRVYTEDIGKSDFSKATIEGALGITWQQSPNKLFIYELNYFTPVDASTIEDKKIAHSNLVENLLGVRFYVQNWLFIDSGIKHTYVPSTGKDDFSVNVNFSGVVPVKSIISRVF